MNVEYRLFEVPVSGWTRASLPKDCAEQLNQLARDGWRVEQVTSLAVGMGSTTTVVFLLARENSGGVRI
jgi:Domain of unknown function (DUF4177)